MCIGVHRCAVEVTEEVGGDLTRYGLGLDDVWLTCQRLRKPSPSATPHYEYKEISTITPNRQNTYIVCVCVPYCPGS